MAEQLWQAMLDHLPQIAGALVALIVFTLLGRALGFAIRRGLRRHDPTLARMLGELASVLMVVLGVLVAAWIAFPSVDFREIFTSLGVTGLILGFALRDLIENFVSGMLILWRRPFHVGDQIRTGNHEGTVQEINFRSTILKSYDGVQVLIPNGAVFTQPLENLTRYGTRRLTILLGIDQTAPVAHAREIILAELRHASGVLAEPPPMVLFEEIGDFANVLHVLLWTEPPTRLSERVTRSEVTERLHLALRNAGINFPYPIQNVRIESMRQAVVAPVAQEKHENNDRE